MESTVRLALQADVGPLMDLLRIMHAEESVEPVDEDKVLQTLWRLINHDGGIVGVIRGDDGIEGTVGLSLHELWYTSARHLSKLWLFVPPEYRRTTHCKLMLQFSKWYSDEVGIPLMGEEIVMPTTEKRVELVGRQLPEFGRMFLYNRRAPAEVEAVAVIG